VSEGRFLLIRRSLPEGDLSWQFPAGEVEDGETGIDAAVRETAEEAGLVVQAKALLGERVHPATGRTMIYVACEVVDGEAYAASLAEVSAVAWCSLEEIPAYVPHGFYEPVQRHLEELLA
jgi:8-oxo-dGTP diphosphatase